MKLHWKTKEGKKLKISEMTTEHIINTINFLRRKGFIEFSVYESYLNSSGPSGEMAQDLYFRELKNVLNHIPSEHLDALNEELEKREQLKKGEI